MHRRASRGRGLLRELLLRAKNHTLPVRRLLTFAAVLATLTMAGFYVAGAAVPARGHYLVYPHAEYALGVDPVMLYHRSFWREEVPSDLGLMYEPIVSRFETSLTYPDWLHHDHDWLYLSQRRIGFPFRWGWAALGWSRENPPTSARSNLTAIGGMPPYDQTTARAIGGYLLRPFREHRHAIVLPTSIQPVPFLLSYLVLFLIALAGLMGAAALVHLLRRWKGRCPQCGYDVSKSNGCPECGWRRDGWDGVGPTRVGNRLVGSGAAPAP